MLYLVSTPIGNLEDITYRAVRILGESDIIVCEDTRQTIKLLSHYHIPQKSLLPFYEEIEERETPKILEAVRSGQKVALVSDSGTPLISDPGYKLVRACIQEGLDVESIPGPTALLSALTVSGLPPDKFVFLGYPPEKQGKRLGLFTDLNESLRTINCTVIFYVSPYKLLKDLSDLEDVFGDISIVLVRELTKIYCELWRGKISEASKKFAQPRGEIVLLFHL